MKRPAPALARAVAVSCLLMAGACMPAQAADEDPMLSLARSSNCLGCHAVDRKLVGPAFKAIAAKYAGHPEMVETLAKKTRLGGGGVWGPMPMPANARVSEADARKLATWVLGLH